ncbi:hypothetical protein [Alysiella filiformis]|uniref:Uncharacterized protein n=1 Tax=Alysiella filiformis DSM 16848 TaxID=1120981 RepID=A0A286E4A3_9NEIS|nr:hypothetical protein [Alysiella filiformis]QMT31009.1 hypothetical protein H3L97_09820 [Alysiella filiformis]UBQ56003.1 hypothetical protein JF568_10650 [Alysiella filiformis DSM 16848]SOD65691.1 hypothetical protein SAMN02746062_00386 [Alysiella filiformis DSM 16848]
MKLKQAKKSLAKLFAQAQGKTWDNLTLRQITLHKCKKNKKKQSFVFNIKTEWEIASANSAVSGNLKSAALPEKAAVQPPPVAEQDDKHHDLLQQIQQLKSQITALKNENTQRQNKISTLNSENNKLKQQLNRMHDLKNENNHLKQSVHYLTEKRDKHQQIVAQKDEVIAQIKQEMYEMKQAAQQNFVPQYTPPKPKETALLQFGQEVDLYENEILSFTRKALEFALKNHTYDKSRYRHVLEDVLQANPLERDVRAEKEREFHKIMHTYHRMDNATRQALSKFGFTLNEQSVHHKIVFMQQTRYTFTISKTGSDIHGGKNCARNVSRFLF